MRVSNKQNDFINKLIINLNNNNNESNVKNIDNESSTINNKSIDNIDYMKEDNRILGNTDYKKYEEISKQIEKEESKNNKNNSNSNLKLGCNNDLRKERQLYEKPTKEKIEATKIFKNEGDYFLNSEKDYNKAFNCYEKALTQLFYTFEDNKEEELEIEKLKTSINLNISICKINQQHYKESIGYLNEAVKASNNTNVKALYRLAYVNFKLEDFLEANNYINKGLHLLKNSKYDILVIKEYEDFFNKLKIDIDNKIKDNEEKNKELSKKMFKK